MEIDNELIMDKVWHLFSGEEFDEAIAILEDYGSESWHVAKERVQICALKMSNGKLSRLRSYMETARGDFRDLLLTCE